MGQYSSTAPQITTVQLHSSTVNYSTAERTRQTEIIDMHYNLILTLVIASLSVTALGRSVSNVKAPNPCSGKYYCETPPDYPATLILNLLRNKKTPLGLLDIDRKNEDRSKTFHNNNNTLYLVQHESDERDESDEQEEVKIIKDIDTEYFDHEDEHPHINEITII